MFGSQSPRLSAPPLSFSVKSVPSALEFSPKRYTKLYPSPTTQLIPSFSTGRKHFARTNTGQPLSLRALLRDSSAPPVRHTPINHLEATLTNFPAKADSKPLTQNLNPLDATLTKIGGGLTSRQRYSPRPLTTHSPHHSATLCLRGTP